MFQGELREDKKYFENNKNKVQDELAKGDPQPDRFNMDEQIRHQAARDVSEEWGFKIWKLRHPGQ